MKSLLSRIAAAAAALAIAIALLCASKPGKVL